MNLLLFVLGPGAFVYAWVVYGTKLRGERRKWRNVLTLIALASRTLSVVMLLPAVTFIDVHYPEPTRYDVLRSWCRLMSRLQVVPLVLALFARRRLIAPLGVASIAVALWWWMPVYLY
jgi:hypothetical protein